MHTRELMAKLLTVRGSIAVCALLLVIGLAFAQTRQGPEPTPLAAARQALDEGRFGAVASLLSGLEDPEATLLRIRADIGQGRYDEALAALAPLASAQPGGDAALEQGRLQWYLGRRADATRTLQGVLARSARRTGRDFLRMGLAARTLRQFRQANQFFREGAALAPDDPALNTAWGELFFEGYENAEAFRSFELAQQANGTYLPARVGAARVLMQDGPPQARALIDAILEVNTDHVEALLLQAEFALDDRKREEAAALIERALAVNPRSLEALALRATLASLAGQDDEFERRAAAVLAINPVYGEVYRVAGDHAARNYLFDEAVVLVRRAVEIDAENARAWSDLGLHLLRTGDEASARGALERAFDAADRAGHGNPVVTNSLELLRSLDEFETIREGDIVMKLHADEAGVMREVAMPLAREALAALSERWDFTPTGPILIEVFPRHDDFAVRTLGLPGFLGALGACFGRVVTMDSPRARPPGTFSWGATLWHELAHVITLQMSNNRVPRWLTEGISVFEERRARAEWGHEMDVSFAQAMNAGEVLKLADLNEGFTDPKTISLAYYEASLLVEHIVERFGEEALRGLLRAYGRGLETDEALRVATSVEMDDLQESFDAAMERRYADLRASLERPEDLTPDIGLEQLRIMVDGSPDSFPLRTLLARALHESGDAAGAIAQLERAAELMPTATGEANPNGLIATIALEQGDTARAIAALTAQIRVDHTNVEAARQLVSLLPADAAPAVREDAYARLAAIDPFDTEAQLALGGLALDRRDPAAALPALRAALATRPPDAAGVNVSLARAYVLAGNLDDAKRHALAALEIAPSFEEAQELLLEIIDRGAAAPAGGR